MIHPTAIVHPDTDIANDVRIGPYAVIGEKVRIKAGSIIGPHAVLEGELELGEGCMVYPHAVIGTPPQDMKYRGEPTKLVIGAGCVFRESATVNRGTESGGGVTVMGERCLLMANAHVAHDCRLGDGVVLANSVALAGHVQVGDGAWFGGMAGVHQFARIGDMAFVGAGAMVRRDVPPYLIARGDRARLTALNRIGLERAGLDADAIARIEEAYGFIARAANPERGAVQVAERWPNDPHITRILVFLENSRLGLSRFVG